MPRTINLQGQQTHTLDDRKFKKLERDLDRVQSKSHARNLDAKWADHLVRKAQESLKAVPKHLYPFVTFEFIPAVAAAYPGRAEGTGLVCDFTQDGRAKKIQVGRTVCGVAPYGKGEILRLVLGPHMFKSRFNLDMDVHGDAIAELTRLWGFNRVGRKYVN